MWGMKATTILVVIGALGLIKKGLEKYIQQITGNIKEDHTTYIDPKKDTQIDFYPREDEALSSLASGP